MAVFTPSILSAYTSQMLRAEVARRNNQRGPTDSRWHCRVGRVVFKLSPVDSPEPVVTTMSRES